MVMGYFSGYLSTDIIIEIIQVCACFVLGVAVNLAMDLLWRSIACLSCAWLIGGCAPATAQFPVWCGQGYTGQATSQTSAAESQDQALNNALSKIGRTFGVTVSSSMTQKQTERDTGSSYEATAVSEVRADEIKILDYKVVQKQTEALSSNHFETCMQITIPDSERARIKRQVDKLAALHMTCNSSDIDAYQCPRGIQAEFGRHITKLGYQLVQGKEHAYFFKLVSETRFVGKEYGIEFYATANLELKVSNADTKNVLKVLNVSDVQGAGYSKQEALDMAIQNGLKKLIEEQFNTLQLGASHQR